MTSFVPGISAELRVRDTDAGLPPYEHEHDEFVERSGSRLTAKQGMVHESSDGLLTAISGNYYWRDRELSDYAKRQDARSTLGYAWGKFGEGLLEHLGGRFSILVWDTRQRTGLVATDRFGQNPVYWHEGNGGVQIAPTADLALQLGGKERQLSKQGIYNYLFFHMVPSPGTIYDGIAKLPPAHALRIDRNGIDLFCYWMPNFNEQADKRAGPAGEEMLHLLQSAVGQLNTGRDTGAFLSGGLDSSTVSGMLAIEQGEGAPTFSIGFDAEGYDEIAFARIASKRFKTHAYEYYVTPEDVLEVLPKVAAAYDEPFGNSSAIPAYFCAKLARDNGMTRLLAGDGGDELFAGNERYARQSLFEAYLMLPHSLRRHIVEPLCRALPKRGVLGKISSYVDQASVLLPARLHTYNFLTRFPTTKLFSADFLAEVDPNQPFQLEELIYHRPRDATRLNRMLYLDWQHTLADNDLRKVNRMCQLAGIEVEYPMLDDLVVEFSTQVSSFRKMRFNRLRDFYKKAVRDFLPEQIINKSKHGFGLPFGVWMSGHAGLQKLAHDNLARFRERDIMSAEFLDELLALHDQSHAGYYGELVWVLVMLELWLTQHGFEPRG